MSTFRKFLLNYRLLSVLVLGFSAGLPLTLTSSTLQAWLTEAHVDLMTIGSLSLLGLPYTLKFLWAPLLDYIGIPHLGRRKGWILLTQLALVFTLLLIAQMNPVTQQSTFILVALAIVFFSASQDVAIDAYRTEILEVEERGLGSAYYIFAYRSAMLVSGGLGLILADYVGWKITYEIMALLVLLAMVPTYKAPKTQENLPTSAYFLQSIHRGLLDLWQRDNILMLLLFIFLYKVGDALALSLMTNFLLKGLGFTLTEVGFAYKLVSFVATILGGLVGGLILVRWHIFKALLVFGIAQAFSNLTFVILAMAGKHFTLMATSIFIENFCSGLSTAALMAFLMSLCNRQFTASQYAVLSAVAAFGRVFLGPLASYMVTHLGWTYFFAWSCVLCLPGLICLLLLRDEVVSHAPAV